MFFANLLATTSVHQKEAMMAMGPVGQGSQRRVKGLQDSIDPTRPPKSFSGAMQQKDGQRHSTRNIWVSSNAAYLSLFCFSRG
jgi:hypothetical protein